MMTYGFHKWNEKSISCKCRCSSNNCRVTKDILEKMIEKGERTVEHGKVLNQELKHNAKQKVKEHVSIQVTKKYDKAFECVDEMSPEDLALLKERIAKAEALQKEKQEAEEDVEVEESEATTDSETSQVQEDETEQ